MAKKQEKSKEPIFLSRKEILEANDLKEEFVKTPEWAPKGAANKDEVGVLVVGLDGFRRDQYQSEMHNAKNKQVVNLKGLTTKLVIASVLDPKDRSQVFNESDLAELQKKNTAPMDRIIKVAQRLSGMGDENLKEILDDLNLTPKDDSGSSSPKK